MPEGNEVHRWAERHRQAFVGKRMRVEAPSGKTPEAEIVRINGRKLLEVRAKGKHLGYVFGKDRILHVHMGQYGDFTEGAMPLPEVRGILRMRMWPVGAKTNSGFKAHPKSVPYDKDDGSQSLPAELVEWLELRGASDCSVWTETQWQTLMERLGPDPLEGDDPKPALERIAKAKTPIGVLLMQQDVIAGIGNIYRAELLFRERLSPFVEGRDVPRKQVKAIWRDAVRLMPEGMVDRRIVTTRAKDRPTKKTGKALKEEAHYVYHRHGRPCLVCETKVERKVVAGRKLYWCPKCQA